MFRALEVKGLTVGMGGTSLFGQMKHFGMGGTSLFGQMKHFGMGRFPYLVN